MAEAVDLSAAAELGIKVSVENAIQNVLGNSDPNSTMAAAQDIVNLENTISRKLNKLTSSLTDVASKIGDLRSSQDETARQNAVTATEAEQQTTPLMRIANTIDLIYYFLNDKFKATGLGTEDANVGMLSKTEKEADPTDEQTEEGKKKEEKVDKDAGSIFVAGAIVAGAVMAIKEKLEETWSGVTMVILKPFIAIREALKSLPKLFEKLKTRISKFTGKIWKGFQAKFPKLAKWIDSTIDTVKGFGKSITNAVKNFKLSKFFAPLFNSIKKISGGGGFGKVIGVLKKFALPLTLVMEAFEAFKMIFVGSFSKNAEAMAESISEKGVLGRAFYGFTHMFQTIAAAVKTQFDTIMITLDILFSDHPDGMIGKLSNIGEILLTPIVELFKDFVIYPIQKALSYIGLTDDPDDQKAKEEESARLSEKARQYNKTFLDDLVKRKASKYGTTEDEYRAYLDYKGTTQTPIPFERWRDSGKKEQNKINEPPIPGLIPVPTKNQDGFNPRGVEQNIQQNSIQNNTTFEVQMPTAASMLNQ